MAVRTSGEAKAPLGSAKASAEEIPAFIFTDRGFMPDPADPEEGAKAWKTAP